MDWIEIVWIAFLVAITLSNILLNISGMIILVLNVKLYTEIMKEKAQSLRSLLSHVKG